jgi:hypothetical protein
MEKIGKEDGYICGRSYHDPSAGAAGIFKNLRGIGE